MGESTLNSNRVESLNQDRQKLEREGALAVFVRRLRKRLPRSLRNSRQALLIGPRVSTATGMKGIAEFAGLEFAGLENDGVEQEETYILHTMK